AERVPQLFQFGLDDNPQPAFRAEDLTDLLRLRLLVFEFLQDAIDLQRRDAVQRQFEDRIDLHLIKLLELLEQLLRRIRLSCTGAEQLEGLVEPVEDDREAFQNVDPLLEDLQFVLEPPADRLQSEVEKLTQNLVQGEPP